MYLTRAQIVGLTKLATSLPVEARFDLAKPDNNGDVFVTVYPGPFEIAAGKEPVYRLNAGGGYEVVREAPAVEPPEEALESELEPA